MFICMIARVRAGFGNSVVRPLSRGQIRLGCGLWGIVATADVRRLTRCCSFHQIGDRVASVDGVSHLDHSHDPVLLLWDVGDRVTILVWVAPLECHSGVGFRPWRVPVSWTVVSYDSWAGSASDIWSIDWVYSDSSFTVACILLLSALHLEA